MVLKVQMEAQKKVKGKRADYCRDSMKFVSFVVADTVFW